MKLRNKKTGEIVVFGEGIVDLNKIGCKNVVEMIEAGWEDYEEPETYYYISDLGNIESLTNDHGQNLPEEIWHKAIKRRKEIGNYFETREEAEKVAEKRKAWQRLEDKGFKFAGFSEGRIEFELGEEYSDFTYDGYDEGLEFYTDSDVQEDLELLFGGEE